MCMLVPLNMLPVDFFTKKGFHPNYKKLSKAWDAHIFIMSFYLLRLSKVLHASRPRISLDPFNLFGAANAGYLLLMQQSFHLPKGIRKQDKPELVDPGGIKLSLLWLKGNKRENRKYACRDWIVECRNSERYHILFS